MLTWGGAGVSATGQSHSTKSALEIKLRKLTSKASISDKESPACQVIGTYGTGRCARARDWAQGGSVQRKRWRTPEGGLSTTEEGGWRPPLAQHEYDSVHASTCFVQSNQNLGCVFVEMDVPRERREKYLQQGVPSAIALIQNEEENAQRYSP